MRGWRLDPGDLPVLISAGLVAMAWVVSLVLLVKVA